MNRLLFTLIAILGSSFIYGATIVVTSNETYDNPGWPQGAPENTIWEAISRANPGDIIDLSGIDGSTITSTANNVLIIEKSDITIIGPVDADGNPTVTISGNANPNDENNHTVIINGANVSLVNVNIVQCKGNCANVTGAGFQADNLIVTDAQRNGIYISGSGAIVENSSFSRTGLSQSFEAFAWIGVNAAGAMNNAGIWVTGDNFQASENFSYDNIGYGIYLSSVVGGELYSNVIGADEDSLVDGNVGDGIRVEDNSSEITIGNIGQGNWIVGNGNRYLYNPANGDRVNTGNMYGDGIEIKQSSTVTIQSNYIGSDAFGTSSTDANGNTYGNEVTGIYINSSSNVQVGGSYSEGRGNVVVANGFAFEDVITSDGIFGVRHGIQLHPAAERPVRNVNVQGNLVGFGVNGECLPNSEDGISFLGGNANEGNVVGGNDPDLGNIIGGSNFGVAFQTADARNNVIQNNIIGSFTIGDANTSCGLKQGGIKMQGGSNNNFITENYIVNGLGDGVQIRDNGSNANEVFDNVIICNEGVGIHLFNEGNRLHGPVSINVADEAFKNGLKVSGFTPNATDKIDVYIADELCGLPCQQSDSLISNGSARSYVGEATQKLANHDYVDTNIIDFAYWEFDLTSALATGAGVTSQNVIVTSTDVEGNTSEFNTCIDIVSCQPPGPIDLGTDLTKYVCEGDSALITFDYDPLTNDSIVHELLDVDSNMVQRRYDGIKEFYVQEAGTYYVYVYDAESRDLCGTISSQPIEVQVQELPETGTIVAVPDDSLCANQSGINLTVSSSQPNSTFTWQVLGNASTQSPLTGLSVDIATGEAGTAQAIATEVTAAPFGCVSNDPDTIDFVINALPIITSILGDDEVCAGDTVIYSIENANAQSTYDWDITGATSFNSSNSEIQVVWSDIAGNVSVIEENAIGCTSATPVELPVVVNERPASPSITGSLELCTFSSDTYTINNPNTTSTYAWSVENATVTPNDGESVTISVTDGTEAKAVIIETTSDACTTLNPDTLSITINSRPNAGDLSVSPDADVCVGESVTLSVANQTGVDFNWIGVSDPTNSNDVVHTPTASGIVKVLVEDIVTGCETLPEDADEVQITLRELPIVNGINGDDTVICSIPGLTYSVQNPVNSSTYRWSLSPNSAQIVGANNSDSTEITIDMGSLREVLTLNEISEYGCVSEDFEQPIIPTDCDLTAVIEYNDDPKCDGDVITFDALSSLINLATTDVTYTWTIPSGTPSSISDKNLTEVDVTFPGPGTYDVTLSIQEFGAPDDTTVQITINAIPDFTSDDLNYPQSICEGYADTVYVNSEAGATYAWEFSEASIVGGNDTLKYVQFGDQTATITVTKTVAGCENVVSEDVGIRPNTNQLTDIERNPVCAGEELSLIVNPTTTGSTYEWQLPQGAYFADSSTMNEGRVVIVPSQSGEVSVTETNSLGCSNATNTLTRSIVVNPIPEMPTLGDSVFEACSGTTATLEITNARSNITYKWVTSRWGEKTGSEVTLANVTANGTGYVQSVSAQNCASDSLPFAVEVLALPSINQIVKSGLLCEDDPVAFLTNDSDETSVYKWSASSNGSNLSDTEGINNKLVSYTFSDALSSAELTLQKTDTNGCVRSTSRSFNLLQDVENPSLVFADTLQRIKDGTYYVCEPSDTIQGSDTLIAYAQYANWYRWDRTNLSVGTQVDSLSAPELPYDTLYITYGELNSAGSNANGTVKVSAGNECNVLSTSISYRIENSETLDINLSGNMICEVDTLMATIEIPEPFRDDTNAYFMWWHNGNLIDSVYNESGEYVPSLFINDTLYANNTAWIPTLNDRDTLVAKVLTDQCVNHAASNDIDTLFAEIVYQANDVDSTKDYVTLTIDESQTNLIEEGSDVYSIVVEGEEIDLKINSTINAAHPFYSPDTSYAFTWYYIAENGDTIQVGSKGFYDKELANLNGFDMVSQTFTTPQDPKSEYFTVYQSVYYLDGNQPFCPSTDSITFFLIYDPFIPTIFSPNNDASFDLWEIENAEMFSDMDIEIYNRWGGLVYKIEGGYNNDWDGTSSETGQALPDGTYFYIVNFNDDKYPDLFKGTVTIMR